MKKENTKTSISLSLQLPAAAFIWSLVVALGVGLTFSAENKRILLAEQLNDLRAETRLIKPLITDLYDIAAKNTLYLSRSPGIPTLMDTALLGDEDGFKRWHAGLSRVYEEFLRTNDFFESVVINDFDGNILVKVSKDEPYVGPMTRPDGQFVQTENIELYNKVVKAGRDDVLFYGVGLERKDGAFVEPLKSTLSASTAIFEAQTNRILGTLELQINFGRLVRFLAETNTPNVSVYLASSNGDYIIHPDIDHIDLLQQPSGQKLQGDFLFLQRVIEQRVKEFETQALLDLGESNVVGRYELITLGHYGENSTMHLFFKLNEDNYLSALEELRYRSFVLAVILAFSALLLSFWGARRLTKPLSDIQQGIADYEKTGEVHDLPLNNRTEIGSLANSFQKMAETLHQQSKMKDEITAKAEELSSRLEFALQAPGIGVWDYDVSSGVSLWDKRMFAIFGSDDKEYKDPLVLWRKRIHPEDFKRVITALNDVDENTKDFNLTFRLLMPSGDIRHLDTDTKVICDESHKPVRLLGTVADVTERRKLEFEREGALKVARDSARAKSDFLATMSHEIRTPMNGVLGMLRILKRDKLTKSQQRNVNLAISSADSLLLLINDILDFSKVDAGFLEIEKIDFDLRRLINELKHSFEARVQEKGLELIVDINAPDDTMMVGDPGRIRQVITNLMGNAIKFTERGHIWISASLTLDETTPQRWILTCSVRDSGIGIPPEKIEKLFDPFTQVDVSTTRKYGGTGLGLAIVKKLVGLMKGQITVNSEINSGSCFEFKLPLRKSSLSKSLVIVNEDESSRAYWVDPLPRILLVEDNSINQEVALGLLKNFGLEADVAADGEIAWEKLKQAKETTPFDLVFMDCQMPVLDGYEATKRIRQGYQGIDGSDIPIIAMTANAIKGDRELCLQIGMDDYLSKPIDFGELEAVLVKWLKVPPNYQGKDGKANGEEDIENSHSIDSPNVEIVELSDSFWEEEAPLWNRDIFGKNIGFSETFGKRLAQIFIDDSPKDVTNLKATLSAQDFEELGKVAHKLKGSCVSMGSERLRDICLQLEKKSLSLQEASDLVASFERNYQDFIDELMQYCQKSD